MTWAPRSRSCFNVPLVQEILPTTTDVYSAHRTEDNKQLILELRSPKSSVDIILRNVRCVHSIRSAGQVDGWVVLEGVERLSTIARADIASAPTDFARSSNEMPNLVIILSLLFAYKCRMPREYC